MIRTIWQILNSVGIHDPGSGISDPNEEKIYSLEEVIDFYLKCILLMARAPSRINEPIPRYSCEKVLKRLEA
jgi:hypothetical protein